MASVLPQPTGNTRSAHLGDKLKTEQMGVIVNMGHKGALTVGISKDHCLPGHKSFLEQTVGPMLGLSSTKAVVMKIHETPDSTKASNAPSNIADELWDHLVNLSNSANEKRKNNPIVIRKVTARNRSKQ